MNSPAFIAGDWGTSHLRLHLCDEAGKSLESISGPGAAAVRGRTEETFFSLTENWRKAHGALPVVMCGMVGSTIGWREVPYLACPVHSENAASGALMFEAREQKIAIAPGLSCRNRLVGPDVMRGEETQILGALRCAPDIGTGPQFLCMPGTHTKWVVLQDGRIESFLTGVTGELFDVLQHHSVLVNPADAVEITGGAAFVNALEQTKLHPDAELIHLLFGTRSRQLARELNPQQAHAYLSGLVIGQDVAGAVRLFRQDLRNIEQIILIGSPKLNELYAAALEMRGIKVRKVDGAQASLAGLTAFHQALAKKIAHAS